MQTVTLGALKRGIDRTRIRGDAGAGALYELKNAYLTTAGRPKKRPPFTKVCDLDSDTVGLFANGGKLRTFYSDGQLTEPVGVNIVYHALRRPIPEDATTAPSLVAVWYDGLFLGKQYVAAEFDDDSIKHYWLQEPGTWEADTMYLNGDVVQPSTPNGYYYRASGDEAPPAWAPGVARAVGDVVQPTVYNGFKYTVVAVAGDSPASGSTEPDWPASEDGQVDEFVDATPPPPAPPDDGSSTPGGDRYGNLPGYKRDQLGLL